MADVLSRCRRLGFPPFIKTDKKISDLDPVTLLWLFYYLLEIYEPSWTHAPKAFTKLNYKPLSTAMRLLELPHKCPKSKELKKPFEHKRSLQSSIGCILDKLEAKYTETKLYSTLWKHASIQGMQQNKNKIKNKNKNKNKNVNKNVNKNIISTKPTQQKHIQISQIPTAISKHLPLKSKSNGYESKQQETAESSPQNIEQKAMEIMDCDNENNDENINISNDISMEKYEINNNKNNNKNMAIDYKMCDLNAFNFDAPNFKNETVKFHIEIQENNNNLTMTERYEKLQQKQIERMKKINKMKEEYNKIAKDLNTNYSFRARLFQDTTSTDYALFQLESIRQKYISEKQLQNGKQSKQSSVDDGIDDLLNSISDQLQNWSK